ncbi:unnamed protein product [Sympodiomycopsis kandeliae]
MASMLPPSLARRSILRITPLLLALAGTALSASISSQASSQDDSSISTYSSSSPSPSPSSQQIRDQWSSVIGWMSIACWVIVYSPQIRENYEQKSGEGLSLAFLFIWFAGDFLNLVGAWRQSLLWTMIVLAIYYVACDVALIWQYYYYQRYADYFKHQAALKHQQEHAERVAHESTPLLSSQATSSDQNNKPLSSQSASDQEKWAFFRREVLPLLGSVALILATGVIAWFYELYHNKHPKQGPIEPSPPTGDDTSEWKWDAQISGWLSAALYLCSRLPQIAKNRQTKCQGLSLALFLFAVAGNVTYIASIMIKSLDKDYLIRNSSWLVGSIGTVFLDFIVLGQFVTYRQERIAISQQQQQQQQEADERVQGQRQEESSALNHL